MEHRYVNFSIGLGANYISKSKYVQLTIFGLIDLPSVHLDTSQGITNNSASNVV